TASGSISMAAGDVYIFTNGPAAVASFINLSTQSNTFDTIDGKFIFNATLGLTQQFLTAGLNIGNLDTDGGFNTVTVPTLNIDLLAQYSNNFALGTLKIGSVDPPFTIGSLGPIGGTERALFLTNLEMDAVSS